MRFSHYWRYRRAQRNYRRVVTNELQRTMQDEWERHRPLSDAEVDRLGEQLNLDPDDGQ